MPGVPIISVISAISKAVEVVGVRIGISISISFCLGFGDSAGPLVLAHQLRCFSMMSMVVTMVSMVFLTPCLAHKLGGFPMMPMVVPVVSMVFLTPSLSILAHGEGSQAENSLNEK